MIELLPVAALTLAALADAWTTYHGLRRGAVEGNPVIRWVMGWAGSIGWIAVKLGLTAAVAILALASSAAWVLWPAALLTGWVAWRNHRVAR